MRDNIERLIRSLNPDDAKIGISLATETEITLIHLEDTSIHLTNMPGDPLFFFTTGRILYYWRRGRIMKPAGWTIEAAKLSKSYEFYER